MKLMACRNEPDWLIRCSCFAVNTFSEGYCPSVPLAVPPDYHQTLCKRGQMLLKDILPPTLKMILKTSYPLPIKQQPSISPPSDITPSSSLFASAESESLWDDQIESKDNVLKVRADDDIKGNHVQMELDRNDGNKRWEVPFVQEFGEEETHEGKRVPKRRTRESPLAGTGVGTPGQPRHPSRVFGDGEIIFC